MPLERSRREFLQLTAMGLTAAAAAESLPGFGKSADPQPGGKIAGWTTGGAVRFQPIPSLTWRPAPTPVAKDRIVVNPEQRFQEILGFGAAFTDASCYLFHQLPPDLRMTLFRELFDPGEMGLSVCRTCIGASDYSTSVFSFDEGDADPDLQRFSIEHDRAYILPMLREARQHNPELFLFSSPWSPPGWMKAGATMLGGSMRKKYFAPYAHYFLKFLQGYAAEGVVIQAVTPQNEVDTDQDGRMPACLWGQEYEIEFVAKHVGPLLQQQGLATQIWILDHNYNLWGRAICELDDPGVKRYSNTVAWHGYAGKASMMSRVHQAHPDCAMHWTEGGPDYTQPDYLTDWTKWSRTFTDVLRNWCKSITAWNLALDEKGRPNIGPFPCGGFVTLHSQSNEVIRSGQYHAMAHYSRAIHRGAYRIDSDGDLPGISHAAFENPTGESVLVLTNSGAAREVVIGVGATEAEVHLAEDSVTTLIWS
jgi:glucosylceramidase